MGMPTQASRAITAALRRLDDIGRLRFVLDVATKDPRTMLNGELIDHRNLIRAFVGAWGGHAAWAADPLDVETLDRLRAHVASGLQTLFRDGVPQSWLLEGSYRLVVAHRPVNLYFACVYTARVTNFLHYPWNYYFQSPVNVMPHDL